MSELSAPPQEALWRGVSDPWLLVGTTITQRRRRALAHRRAA